MPDYAPLYWIGFVLLLVIQLWAALHALLYKRDPRSSAGWVAVSLMFPLLGPLLYFLFGINRVRSRGLGFNLQRSFGPREDSSVTHIESRVAPHELSLPRHYTAIANVSEGLSGRPLLANNRVEPLINGDEAYPAMLEAINQAQSSVYMTTYIFNNDDTGGQFADALERAKNRGVDVRVLVDGVGVLYSLPRTIVGTLAGKGIKVAKFHPPSLFPPTFTINLRNHRKILVADGQIGFSGGLNVADTYFPNAPEPPKRASDVHFRFGGPVVSQLQQAFLQDWAFATGDSDKGPEADLPADCGGRALCRVMTDGPDEDTDKLSAVLVNAVTASQERIAIVTPYFIPDRQMISALRIAALRGVDVNVVLPAINNLVFVHWATRNMLWELLLVGVHIHYQPAPFAHTKLFVVDDHYTLIGSANIDPRSLRLNFEIGIEIFDAELNEKLYQHIDALIRVSKPVNYEDVEGRSLSVKVRDSIAWLFSPYL
jgi:cardiolipin synthase